MGYSSKKGFNRLKDVYELSKTMQDALLQKHKIQKFSWEWFVLLLLKNQSTTIQSMHNVKILKNNSKEIC